jgi:hypothetical protein
MTFVEAVSGAFVWASGLVAFFGTLLVGGASVCVVYEALCLAARYLRGSQR